MLAESKADKTRITAEVLARVRNQLSPPGRFLQKIVEGNGKNDPYSIQGFWYEIDDGKASAKISQALREGAPAFKASHGKKGRNKSTQRSSTRRKRQGKRQSVQLSPGAAEEEDYIQLSPQEKKKSPPEFEASPTRKMQSMTALPPLPPLDDEQGKEPHDLDVLFPTANNVFEVSSPKKGNGHLLDLSAADWSRDYNVPMADVAAAVPPTPPTVHKPKLQNEAMLQGKCNTPSNKSILPQIPNTPLVSPGFSPFASTKATWDAISFLPPTPVNTSKPRLPRVHSLSPFSDDDEIRSEVSSFKNPFENNHITLQEHSEVETPLGAEVYPTPLPAAPRGLSFGRIGNAPEGNTFNNIRQGTRYRSSSSRSMRRESSLSSNSFSSSNHNISNLKNNKRRSIC